MKIYKRKLKIFKNPQEKSKENIQIIIYKKVYK